MQHFRDWSLGINPNLGGRARSRESRNESGLCNSYCDSNHRIPAGSSSQEAPAAKEIQLPKARFPNEKLVLPELLLSSKSHAFAGVPTLKSGRQPLPRICEGFIDGPARIIQLRFCKLRSIKVL